MSIPCKFVDAKSLRKILKRLVSGFTKIADSKAKSNKVESDYVG